MKSSKDSESSQVNPSKQLNEKSSWVSGFLIFIGPDGKTYKGEAVKVSNFSFEEPIFSATIEGVAEPAKHQAQTTENA